MNFEKLKLTSASAAKRALVILRSRRFQLRAGIALAVFAICGFLIAPPIVRSVAQKQATAALGRTVSIERVRINPFALSASIEGLRIAGNADEKADFVAISSVEANFELWASLWYRGPVLHALRVHQPHVRIARLDENRFNFSDILDRMIAQAAEKTAPSSPLRFSLNNIELDDGVVEFDDRPVGAKHLIDRIGIGLPFLSNVPSKVLVEVTPHIDARVNGSELSLKGEVKPFADHREATLDLKLEAFDVTRYLGYVPSKLPGRIAQAFLSSSLECVWAEHVQGQTLSLRGDVSLDDVRYLDDKGADLVAWKHLIVGLKDVQPIATPMKLAFSRVQLDGADVHVHRLRDGTIALPRMPEAPAPSASAPAAERAPQKPAAAPLISVDAMAVQGGSVRWLDDALPESFATRLASIDLKLTGLDLQGKPAALEASLQADSTGNVKLNGTIDAAKKAADIQIGLSALRLERYRPYYMQALGAAKPAAGVDASLRLSWSADKAAGLRIADGRLQLSALTVPQQGEKKPIVQIAALEVGGFALDMEQHLVEIGQINSRDAHWRLVRDAEGINLLRAFAARGTTQESSHEKPEQAPVSDASAPAHAAAPVWTVRTGKADVSGWNASLEDRTGKEPVSVSLDGMRLQTASLSTAPDARGQLTLDTQVNRRGHLHLGGELGLTPMRGTMRLDAKAVDLLFLQPYLSSMVHVLLTNGTLDARGDMNFDLSSGHAPKASWAGDIAVNDFTSLDQINDTEFVRWKRFSFGKLRVNAVPLDIAAAEVRLEDIHSRLILDQAGNFNLREIMQTGDEPAPDAMSAPASAASSSASASSTPAMKVKIDQIIVAGGDVSYSDRFVKPGYDAHLTDLDGSLRGLSSDKDSVADLLVKAMVDHSAPVDISGQLNPLRKDRVLDIKARVTDIDLTSVSTYSGRYIGYGISKGKLSMNVAYQIRDRKLTAQNQLYLDQLTFGDRVDSPNATHLPVQLAVALLRDRNGVIDLNLPISGTLDDPQFSVGGILLRAFVNLITKAVTSPFALLGSMFGGGDELSFIDFDAGLASLPANGPGKLTSLAKALTERPGLRLDISGSVDPARDGPGLRRNWLEGKLRAAKAERLVKQGERVSDIDALTIGKDEYAALLEDVYKDMKIDKPRNAIGLAKSIPVGEMEKLILDSSTATDADLLSLANRRALVVRDWLVNQGKVAASRIFVVEPRVGGRGGEAARSRVDFSLK